MKEFQYVIQDELGIHARPAGNLAKLAQGFPCDVKVTCNGKTVDAKRVIGLMTLGAKKESEVTIACDGADEEKAAEALEAFFKENL